MQKEIDEEKRRKKERRELRKKAKVRIFRHKGDNHGPHPFSSMILVATTDHDE